MTILARVLALIPTHPDERLSAAQIAARARDPSKVPLDRVTIDTILEVLSLFECLDWQQDKIRSKNQMSTYFIKSLTWFDETQHSLCSNWERSGTSGSIDSDMILDRTPHLLKIPERRRMNITKLKGLQIQPSRFQPCSIVVIKTTRRGKSMYLHQFDQAS